MVTMEVLQRQLFHLQLQHPPRLYLQHLQQQLCPNLLRRLLPVHQQLDPLIQLQ